MSVSGKVVTLSIWRMLEWNSPAMPESGEYKIARGPARTGFIVRRNMRLYPAT
jgi:hypothetical protein